MKIKLIPQLVFQKQDTTEIEKINENAIRINGEDHQFPAGLDFYDVNDGTFTFLKAERKDGELFLDVLFQYGEKDAKKYKNKEFGYEAI